MPSRYERNRDARRTEIDRRTLGETLAEYHARENPAPTKPGAHLPRVRCDRTPYLFGWGAVLATATPPAYYDQPPEPPRQGQLFGNDKT